MTLVSLLLMGPVVAGVVEEASFRGYMQGPIERRHGPVVAILVTGTLFGFAHFTHPEVTPSPSPAPPIWETGADASFSISSVAFLIVGAATVWAYARLASVVEIFRETMESALPLR